MAAVYARDDLAGDYVITRDAWTPHRTHDSDTLVAVSLRDGVPLAEGAAGPARRAARRAPSHGTE